MAFYGSLVNSSELWQNGITVWDAVLALSFCILHLYDMTMVKRRSIDF